MLTGKRVAYVRLRWGHLTCNYKEPWGELIYDHQFSDGMKGMFEDEKERKNFLKRIEKKINEYLKDKK